MASRLAVPGPSRAVQHAEPDAGLEHVPGSFHELARLHEPDAAEAGQLPAAADACECTRSSQLRQRYVKNGTEQGEEKRNKV